MVITARICNYLTFNFEVVIRFNTFADTVGNTGAQQLFHIMTVEYQILKQEHCIHSILSTHKHTYIIICIYIYINKKQNCSHLVIQNMYSMYCTFLFFRCMNNILNKKKHAAPIQPRWFLACLRLAKLSQNADLWPNNPFSSGLTVLYALKEQLMFKSTQVQLIQCISLYSETKSYFVDAPTQIAAQ